MSLASLLTVNVAALMLVVSRIAGFVVVSPFPGPTTARTQRVGLLCVLSWVAFSLAPSQSAPTSVDLNLVGPVIIEVACGLTVGLAFRCLISAADILGTIVGQMTGHSTPTVLNPTINAEDTAVGRLVGLGAMLVALGAGVHRVALASLLESFRALPVGTETIRAAGLLPLVDLEIDAFAVGVRLGTPLIAVALLVQTSLGVISRAAPTVQIFSVGFGVLFLSGSLVFVETLGDMMTGLAAHFGALASIVDRLLTHAFQ